MRCGGRQGHSGMECHTLLLRKDLLSAESVVILFVRSVAALSCWFLREGLNFHSGESRMNSQQVSLVLDWTASSFSKDL